MSMSKFKMNDPLDDLGLEAMADWLAPRIKESPLWKMAMSNHDPELIAIMLERLLPEYFESIEFPAIVTRKGTLVYMQVKGEDEGAEPVNVSVPFTEAVLSRMGIRPVF